jgi:hypothetical protein
MTPEITGLSLEQKLEISLWLRRFHLELSIACMLYLTLLHRTLFEDRHRRFFNSEIKVGRLWMRGILPRTTFVSVASYEAFLISVMFEVAKNYSYMYVHC